MGHFQNFKDFLLKNSRASVAKYNGAEPINTAAVSYKACR